MTKALITSPYMLLMSFMIQVVNCGPEFGTIKFSRCLLNDNDIHLHGLSWSGCLQSCRDREQCLAVSYRRAVHHCIISYGGKNTVFDICRGFVFSEKISWNEKGPACNCSGLEVCENNGRTGTVCSLKECKTCRQIPKNGQIHGNMMLVGSNVQMSCNKPLVMVGQGNLTCDSSGHWVDSSGHVGKMPLCVSSTPQFVWAFQSTTLTGSTYYATNAIDGNYDNNAYRGSCSHTDNNLGDTWTGVLEMVSLVKKLELYTRGDCCRYRTTNFSVHVDDQLCVNYICPAAEAPLVITIHCPPGLVGSKVTITQHLNYGLTICEVDVY